MIIGFSLLIAGVVAAFGCSTCVTHKECNCKCPGVRPGETCSRCHCYHNGPTSREPEKVKVPVEIRLPAKKTGV